MIVITNVEAESVRMRMMLPVLPVLDMEIAKDFYGRFLGFTIEQADDHPNSTYAIATLGALALYLAPHDSSTVKGTTVVVRMQGLREFSTQLTRRRQHYPKPTLKDIPSGQWMELTDPFGNALCFAEDR